MNIIEGNLDGKGLRIAIIMSRFNDFIVEKLLSGAVDTLLRSGLADDDISVYKVPGAFEIPLTAKQIAFKGNLDAIICLGAIIQGDTPHFQYIAGEVTKGIAMVSIEANIPVIFGILTTDNIQQAIERAGTKQGNKGKEAALSAIEMANIMKQIKEQYN